MSNQFFVIIDESDEDKFRQLKYNTYEKLLKKLGYPDTRFWGFSDKDNENFNKVEIGDLILFANKDDSNFSFYSQVSGKAVDSDLAVQVFGDDFRTKIHKNILFFDNFFESSINYHEVLRSTGKDRSNSGLYQIQHHFKKLGNSPSDTAIPSTETSLPIDLAGPPPRIKIEVTRFIRDTGRSKDLKKLYDHRCQVCGYRICKPDNTFYSEVHHIWPLGKKPIGGDDDFNNMLVLCPTHHAEFDYGVIKISKDKKNIIDEDKNIRNLFFMGNHEVEQKNIDQQFE